MLRFLADENFNGDILRGILLQHPMFNVVRAQDVGLTGMPDPILLEWAADNDRILLTHDRATIPDFAYVRCSNSAKTPGVFAIGSRMAIGLAIEQILLAERCSDAVEWEGIVLHLPL